MHSNLHSIFVPCDIITLSKNMSVNLKKNVLSSIFQKTNAGAILCTERCPSIRFLEEFRTPKFAFEIYWPLTYKKFPGVPIIPYILNSPWLLTDVPFFQFFYILVLLLWRGNLLRLGIYEWPEYLMISCIRKNEKSSNFRQL